MFRKTVRTFLMVCFFVAAAGLVVSTQPPAAYAAAFVVNDNTDTDDGTCDNAPDCTLREAINAANALGGADTITFNIPLMAGCTAANDCTITLGTMLPAIADDVTIDGAPNNGKITVSGNNAVRVMLVNATRTLNLNALTIANGKTGCSTGGCNTAGGGISNNGTLNLTNSTVSGNTVTCSTGDGGCVPSGAGIFNNGALTVTNSTFAANSNTCVALSCDGAGGGILNAGTLTVTNSTFSGNSVTCTGTVFSCTGFGGGIANFGSAFTVINSTFGGNSASCSAGGPCDAAGGGIYNYISTATLKNTLFSANTGGDCANDGGGNMTGSPNFDSDGSCPNATTRTVAEINLQSLANNGGPTQTRALGNSSVAIDAGNAAVCAAAAGAPTYGADGQDQRGFNRNDLNCDIGAFEFVFSDGHTVSKTYILGGELTFGPTLAKINSSIPLTLDVNRELTPPGNSPPAGALPITWNATTTASGFSLGVTLCYDPAVITTQDENLLRVFHFNGSSWDDLGGTLDTGTYALYHCVSATTPLTSTSPLILATNQTTAVNVTGFAARVEAQGSVLVKWQTASESKIAGFEVWRRGGGAKWKQVSGELIQAKRAGDSRGARYHFQDTRVKRASTYRYRIQVLYLDQHREWTEVITVKTP